MSYKLGVWITYGTIRIIGELMSLACLRVFLLFKIFLNIIFIYLFI